MNLQILRKFKKEIPPVPHSIWRKPLHFIAFGFGTGALPIAPGTFGTLIAIPFYLLLAPLPLTLYLFIVSLLTLGSVLLCERVEKELTVHDHPGMCVDEIIGYLVTMIGAPHGTIWVVLGFLLFRFFDICKPWPIHYIDKNVQGGLGVILDDALAGVYSFLILQLIFLLSRFWV
jgi:phosphatidylglycerophosphatase A